MSENTELTNPPKEYSTRLCLKNLPPKLSTTSTLPLRRHLSSILPSPTCITEIRILTKNKKNRNMAFVGFTKYEHALKCMNFFNNSYAGTSKLIVEWALSKDNHGGLQKKKSMQPWLKKGGDKGTISTTIGNETISISNKKMKVTTSNKKEKDLELELKKREFLSLSKNNIYSWQNDANFDNDGENYTADGDDPNNDTQKEGTKSISALDFLKSKVTQKEKLEDETAPSNDNTNTSSNRLFLRNLSYQTTEVELSELFSSYGVKQSDCHIPVDDSSKHSKGIAFITFSNHDLAIKAMQELDKCDFQGRILHIRPANHQPEHHKHEYDTNNTSFKLRKEKKRKREDTTKSWNTAYLPSDTVLQSTSDKLQVDKSDVLNLEQNTSGTIAVRMAMAETEIIQENKKFFQEHGIDLSSNTIRSDTKILVKNIPPNTTVYDIQQIFNNSVIGGKDPKTVLLSPSNTLALIEYEFAVDAKKAFRYFSYKRLFNVPLYLEWAPLLSSSHDSKENNHTTNIVEESTSNETTTTQDNEDEHEEDNNDDNTISHSIFIKNLNFSTTEEQLQNHISSQISSSSIRAVKIPQKILPNKTKLNLGYGFVEFTTASITSKALKSLQESVLHGHKLQIQLSTKSLSSTSKAKVKKDQSSTKIIVRNLPFQASKSELHSLFASYGQVKKIRIPKKFGDSGHRGFGFVEFHTHKEAKGVMEHLGNTHLYGRHLVLEWASALDDEKN